MNNKLQKSLGENLRNRFQLPAVSMGNYYWIIHTRMYPPDFAATALSAKEYIDTNAELAKKDADKWAKAPRRLIGRLLTQQLLATMDQTIDILGVPDNLTECLNTGKKSQVIMGLDIVRKLALRQMEQDGYTAKNPLLEKIGNPFSDPDTFGYFYDMHDPSLRPKEKQPLLPLATLVPGIDVSRL